MSTERVPILPPSMRGNTHKPRVPILPPSMRGNTHKPRVPILPPSMRPNAIAEGIRNSLLLTRNDQYEYQKNAVDFLHQHKQSMLYVFIAGGKTNIGLTYIKDLKNRNLTSGTLLISTTRICASVWEKESKKWEHLKDLTFNYLTGTKKERTKNLFKPADIYVLNFENLSWLSGMLETYFLDQNYPLPFDVCMIDEVSKMKTITSKRVQAFANILPHFKRHVSMTGSLYGQGYENMFGMYYIVDQGTSLGANMGATYGKDLGLSAIVSYSAFLSRFFNKVSSRSKPTPHKTTLSEIIKCVAPITYVISKNDVAVELPKVNVIEIDVYLPPRKMEEYNRMEEEFFIELDEKGDDIIEFDNAATLNNKLQQYANGFIYYWGDDEKKVRKELPIHDRKFEAFGELINDEIGDESVLCVYQYNYEKEKLLELHPDMECLTGTTPSVGDEMIDRFSSGELKRMLIHSKSAAHGLNLQKSCDNLIFFGIGYSFEEFEQTVGRLERGGSLSNHVNCFLLLTRNTFNEVIYDAIKNHAVGQDKLRNTMGSYVERLLNNSDPHYSKDTSSDDFKLALKAYRQRKYG